MRDRLPRRARRIRSAGLALIAMVGSLAGRPRAADVPARRVALQVARGPRVRVEILNASRVHGLARLATRYLRDQGFDVVAVGTVTPSRDTTLVLDRTGHPDWAGQVARALAAGHSPTRAESRPDPSRDVDVTVLLAGAWRAPPEPFDP
jgi:hypothetical protein